MHQPEYFQSFRGEKVRRVERQIANLAAFETPSCRLRAIHQKLAKHYLQTTDWADITNGRRAMQGHFVAIYLGSKQNGCFLLLDHLKSGRTQATHRCASATSTFGILIVGQFGYKCCPVCSAESTGRSAGEDLFGIGT